MPAFLVDLLKYVFLGLMFLFLWMAIRAMNREVSRSGPQPARPQKPAGKAPERIVVDDPAAEASETYEIVDELILGRGEGCNVTLSDTFASQIHARIFKRDGEVLLEDMGSTNGTRLNGKRVTSPITVVRGDVATIGKTQIAFKR